MIDSPYAIYEVEHTHVSLGTDLSNLLHNELNQGQEKSTFFRFVRSGFFRGAVAIFFSIGCFIVFAGITSVILGDILFVGKSLDDLVQSGRLQVSIYVSVVLSVTAAFYSVFLAKFFLDSLLEEKPSFIVLSERARVEANKRIRKFERRWIKQLAILVGTLVMATISGYASEKLRNV